MQYQVFVQNPAERKFVASIVGIPAVSEEGATEEEAVFKAKAALEAQLARGKFITIELPQTNSPEILTSVLKTAIAVNHKSDSPTPTMKYAGIFANDPSFDDWTEKLAIIRQQANAADDEQ
ncbi:type II toxin-antitoxin system HicB family antitoxin [Aliterella atlantica]|uniref:Uncharacterized protein n=1 Tax=Aliterella atlantica CENA595 TaxID=1618023 RepID=A0A0D8ZMT9_9CYAN|nr:hypothetical protein [Aliterella atlantica]KJH69754.1 hypothetical protein UH38_21775 [Aliterella atlantica CENA595]